MDLIGSFQTFDLPLVAGQTPKYALLGQSIMFNADMKTPPDEILWKHDGNKVVEFDGNQEQLYGSYVNRVILDWLSADLEINQLRYEDSGTYELDVFTKKVLDRSTYKLEVIDKVPEPTITCEMNKGSSSDESGNQATLTCSAELRQSPSLTKFEWSSNGNVQSGRNLTISLGDEHDNEVYSCTVSNPLTKESAVFTAKECYPDKDSSTALIVGILIPILLGLAIFFILCILWRKGCFCKKSEEDLEQTAFDEIKDDGVNGDEGKQPLLDRDPLLPSHPPVQRNNDREELEQEKGQDKTPQKGFVKNLVSKFETPQHIPAGSQKNKHNDWKTSASSLVAKEPAAVLDHSQELYEKEKQEANEGLAEESGDQKSDQAELASGISASTPASQPCLHSTKNSPNMAPHNETVEHKDDASSGQVAEEHSEESHRQSDSSSSVGTNYAGHKVKESSSTTPESGNADVASSGQVAEEHSEESHGQSDSSSSVEKNDVGHKVKESSSTTPEADGAEETAHTQNSELPQTEMHSKEEPLDKQVFEYNNKLHGIGDQEETDPPFQTPPESQSPTASKPDNSNYSTFQGSPESAHAVPDQEEKDNSHSDSSTEEEDKSKVAEDKNEDQCCPGDNKIKTESVSGDEESQKNK